MRVQEINTDQCDVACIRQWNLSTLQMRITSEEEKANDIRRVITL